MTEEKKIPSRVSITYSVDFIEVPERVKILMNEMANSFGGIAKLCREAAAITSEEPISSVRKMADIKTIIEKTALRADDCIEIMLGYINVIKEASEQEEPQKKATKKKATKKKATKKATKKKAKKED